MSVTDRSSKFTSIDAIEVDRQDEPVPIDYVHEPCRHPSCSLLEPDIAAIDRKHVESPSTQELVYWPLIPSEIWRHLVPTKGLGKNERISLVAGQRCIASGRRERYDDTQSLEVMIRANALWYEINIQPFEKDVISAG